MSQEEKGASDVAAGSREKAIGREALFALVAEIATGFIRTNELSEALRWCVQALVRHLDVAFARIWTVDDEGRWLVLRASAGLYTHIDGSHARIEVGQLKIGTIALQRRPHLTNAVIGDPLVHDQEWARREGMVSFAGYPLVAGSRLIGVMAMFARHPLASGLLEALGSVAEVVTVGIERAAAGDLRIAKERAEEASRVKSEVLSVVSHELRTPLSVIRLAIDHLRHGRAANQLADPAALARMERQARRLERLVDDLQVASRMERGQLVITPRLVDLRSVLAEAVADLRERAPEREIRLDMDDAPAQVVADAPRIGQVLANFFENALKYSAEHSPIEVRLSSFAAEVRVEVTDHGSGIPAHDKDAVFAPFVRLASTSGGVPGLGLGLHICRQLIAAHGGHIGCESEPGTGSTFWFSLPRAQQPSHQEVTLS